MDSFWINLAILIFILVIIIRNWHFIYISIVCLPRDISGFSLYLLFMFHSFYCKYTNKTAARYFDCTVKKRKEKPCFLYEDEIWTYEKVQQESYKIARYFKSQGYKKGDAIGLFMESRPHYVCVWLGLSRIGVITSLLNYNLRLQSLEHCVKVSNCKAVIFGSELTNEIHEIVSSGGFKDVQLFSYEDKEELLTEKIKLDIKTYDSWCVNLAAGLSDLKEKPVEYLQKYDDKSLKPSDLILYIFTSGTTGLPKAVKMTHSKFFVYASAFYPLGIRSKDIVLTTIPLYHIHGGVIGVSCPLFFGVPQVILRKFSASQFWKQCTKYEVTMVQYMGEIIRYLYNQPESPEDNLHKVEAFFGTGVNPAIWGKFLKRFNIKKIKEMYGSTEGTSNLINCEGHEGAVGYVPIWAQKLLPLVIARMDQITGELIRDPVTGLVEHAKTGESGEIMSNISATNPLREFTGYLDDEATSKKIARDVKKKGDMWFRSGDIGMFDKYCYVYFKDRTGDTFKWRGENVSTAEVEQIVARGTDFKCNTVYGVQIPGNEGRCGMAAISDLEGNLNLTKLANEVTRFLPSYARPLFLRVLKTEMKMTGTFKLQKLELQKEGIDVRKIGDAMYFLDGSQYIPLNNELYNRIISGDIRL